MAGATAQKTPKSETNSNRLLLNDACAYVWASGKCHNRIHTVAAHITKPAIHNHFKNWFTAVIRIGLFPARLLEGI
jgi:hypothetical protein